MATVTRVQATAKSLFFFVVSCRGFAKAQSCGCTRNNPLILPKQFGWAAQTAEKVSLQFRFRIQGAKCPFSVRRLHGLLTTLWQGPPQHLARTKKAHTLRGTSMSTQLICKVIKILETLISIILMN